MGQKVEDEKDRLLERVGGAAWQRGDAPPLASRRCWSCLDPPSRDRAMLVPTEQDPPLLPALLQFVEFAKAVCERLAAAGHWADYIDPCRCGGGRAGMGLQARFSSLCA
jgi:hypothetical protein